MDLFINYKLSLKIEGVRYLFLQKLPSKQYSQTLIINANRCEKNMSPNVPTGSTTVMTDLIWSDLIFLIELLT